MENHPYVSDAISMIYIYMIYIYIYIYYTESSVVSAHVLGSLLLPLFSMNLPIQKKKYGCTCHFNIASPTGKPQEQNSLHKIKLHNWKTEKTKKKQKKQKNQRFQRKVGGLIVAGSLVFLFFLFFFVFLVFSVFVFFWWFCLLYRLAIGVVLPWKCFLHISWTARPNFRFSGGGGSVCVIFFWARNTTLFSKEWTNIIYCILFKENLHKGILHCGLWKSNCLLKNTLSK